MTTPAVKDSTPRRMTLSQVVEHLLSRGSSQSSSVSLTRNAKGETQIEVVVRTDAELGIVTPHDAANVADDVYAKLREHYPFGPETPTPAAGS